MKKLLVALMLTVSATVSAQEINIGSGITPPTGPIVTHQMRDDGHVTVPIPFGFPYYGQIFTHSFMFDNGVVGLYSPGINTNPPIGCNADITYCGGNQWSSQPLSNLSGPTFNYMIAPLWTDLLPRGDSTYTTQGDSTQITYSWNRLGEYYNPNNINSFDLQLKPSGSIGIQYREINIGQSSVSVGLTGNLAVGEYVQHYWAPAGTTINSTTNTITDWNVIYTTSICSDPAVSNQYCSTGTIAYTNWQVYQCSINPLEFNGLCQTLNPVAWLDYKCTTEGQLYSSSCPDYETAYTQWQIAQCVIDPLSFNGLCQTIAPDEWLDYKCTESQLYSASCPLYDDAYYVQQCTINPLYDNGCTGYAEAYALKFIVNSPMASSEPIAVTVSTETASTPQLVSDPVVNQTLTTTTTSSTPSNPVAPVQLAPSPQPVTTVAAATEEKKEETKTETASSDSTATASTASTSENKDQPKTTRQALAERRLEAARAKAVEDGKQLAGKMGEAASMEAQIQVQGIVMAAMGFVPGFDSYGRVALQDAIGYKPFEVYQGQRNVDNPAGRRFLTGADRMHQEMVDQQYTR